MYRLVIVVVALAIIALVTGWLLARSAKEDQADFDVTSLTEDIVELRVMARARSYIANVDELIPDLTAALHAAECERLDVPANATPGISPARTLALVYPDGNEALLICSGPETWYHPIPEDPDWIIFEGSDFRVVYDALEERFGEEDWW